MFEPILLQAFNPGPMTGEGNNTYLIAGEGSATLIDAGIGDARHLAALEEALTARQARLEDVVVTHAHGDHALGATALARAYPDARFRKYLWPAQDAHYAVNWLPLTDGETIRAGDTELRIVFTPGHSPDHIALWHDASRTALVGDLVVLGTTVMIAATKGGDMAQYLASLERVRALNAARLLPAHGQEITDAETILARYLEHRQRREAQVISALAAGFATVQEVTESIYHGLPASLVPAAAENVAAHLEKLRQDGRAVSEQGRWLLK